MIEVIREFDIKEESRSRFELAFGPGGAWSSLFARCPGFRGTTVLRDTQNPGRYLTIELWETEAQREQVLTENRTGYSELEAAFDEWTESRTKLGVFSVLAAATVRPRDRSGRGMTGTARQRIR